MSLRQRAVPLKRIRLRVPAFPGICVVIPFWKQRVEFDKAFWSHLLCFLMAVSFKKNISLTFLYKALNMHKLQFFFDACIIVL